MSEAGKRGPVVFAGQKPYPAQGPVATAGGIRSDPVATAPVGADLRSVFAEAQHSPVLLIVLGVSFVLATLIPVGLLIALMLRPASAPKVDAPLPALVALPPPLLDSASQTIGQISFRPSNRRRSNSALPQRRTSRQRGSRSADDCPAAPLGRRTTPPVILAPLPPRRPLDARPLLGRSSRLRLLRRSRSKPPPRPLVLSPSPFKPGTAYDQWGGGSVTSPRTRFTCRTGTRLEAHSGLRGQIRRPPFRPTSETTARRRQSLYPTGWRRQIALPWRSGFTPEPHRRRIHLQSGWAANASLHAWIPNGTIPTVACPSET